MLLYLQICYLMQFSYFDLPCICFTLNLVIQILITYFALASDEIRGEFRGGATPAPSGTRPPADPKGTLCTILRYPLQVIFGLFFFENFACCAENLANTGTKLCLWRARKINSVDLKKRSINFRKFATPRPRENPRSAPG